MTQPEPSPRWPPTIATLFDGSDLGGKAGVTAQLVTQTDEGWPHLAMLSVGEILILGDRGAALGLWPTSTTAANLSHRGKATLALVHERSAWLARMVVEREAQLPVDGDQRRCFITRLVTIREDVAPYAELVSGIRYRLKDPAEVFGRWRRSVEVLRRFGTSA